MLSSLAVADGQTDAMSGRPVTLDEELSVSLSLCLSVSRFLSLSARSVASKVRWSSGGQSCLASIRQAYVLDNLEISSDMEF